MKVVEEVCEQKTRVLARSNADLLSQGIDVRFRSLVVLLIPAEDPLNREQLRSKIGLS